MNHKVVCVDVDLTLVDTLTPWISWWENKTGTKFDWSSDLSINKQLCSYPGYKDYWDKKDLYDNLLPLDHSVRALEKLSKTHSVFFVTKCTEGHYNSKVSFLNRFFPFNEGVINTRDKHLIEADIYFEDHTEYVENIINNRPHSKVYQFMTLDNAGQEVEGAIQMDCWSEI